MPTRENFLRFLFSAEDQARMESIEIKDVPFPITSAITGPHPHPQAMQITFKVKVNNLSKGAPQIRPLFPGNITFLAGAKPSDKDLPQPGDVHFTPAAYDTWNTTGTLMVVRDPKPKSEIAPKIEAIGVSLEVKPTVVWYSPVVVSQDFLFKSLVKGLPKPDYIKGRKGKIKKDNPKWDEHAVSRFLRGLYSPELGLDLNDPDKDHAVLFSMPTVKMENGMVTLIVATARRELPKDGLPEVLDRDTGLNIKPQIDDKSPAHFRNGAIPARHVYRSLRQHMIDAGTGSVADEVFAEWPKAPRYFPLRFTRTWKAVPDCSVHFPLQTVTINDQAGNHLFEGRLPSHGMIYLSQAPTTPQSGPQPLEPQILVSLAGGMRYLKGETPDVWRVKGDLTPLDYDLQNQQPHIVVRRRMNDAMLDNQGFPTADGPFCSYFSFRRTLRALIDNRITGGRLNYGVKTTSKEIRKLLIEAWQKNGVWFVSDLSDRLVANNQPPIPLTNQLRSENEINLWLRKQSSSLIPILSAFFFTLAPQTMYPLPANAQILTLGEMAYHLWQSNPKMFEEPETESNFNQDHIGQGAPGALVALDLATYHFDASALSESYPDADLFADQTVEKMLTGLEPGDLLQFWHFKSDFDEFHKREYLYNSPHDKDHYGHSPIFYEYLHGAKKGFKVIDQSGKTQCLLTIPTPGKRKIKWNGRDPLEVWIAAKWKE